MKRESTYNAKVVHPYAWLWDPLETDPTFVLRAMFGAKAVYLAGRLVLCFCARKEPWHGVLVCTEQAHHESLMRAIPALKPHPILPKWLYLSDAAPQFERDAEGLVELVRRGDRRIGVEPGARRKRRGNSKVARRRPR